jgi:hypothetical protein
MRTPTQYAEDIKIRYACALSQLANPDESIEVPSVGDRPARRLARQTLAEIVEPRYEELFGLVREELRRSGFEEVIAAGIVLTGGSAKMEGAIELAEEVFHVPVGSGTQSDFLNRRGAAALCPGQCHAHTPWALPGWKRKDGVGPHAFLVPGQLLKLTDDETGRRRGEQEPQPGNPAAGSTNQ